MILSYDNVRKSDDCIRVLPDSPFLAVRLVVSFLVFSPDIGMTILGTVNKQSCDHIGLIVLGAFNASISSLQIRQDTMEWREEAGEWFHIGSGRSICVGDEIPFCLLE